MSKHSIFAVRLCASAFALIGATTQAHSTGMVYSPTLPQFGGLNGQALTLLQFEKQLEDQRDARRAAALREQQRAESATSSSARRLVDTISNFINVEIARQFSNEILSGESGEGTLFVDGAEIRYSRSEDFLNVVVTDGLGGETEVRVPLTFTIPGVDASQTEMP